jgi:hypothetical protein
VKAKSAGDIRLRGNLWISLFRVLDIIKTRKWEWGYTNKTAKDKLRHKTLKGNCIKTMEDFFFHAFQKCHFYDQQWEIHFDIKRGLTILEGNYRLVRIKFRVTEIKRGKTLKC